MKSSTSRCRYCGEPIVWAITRECVRRPFDARGETRYVLDGRSARRVVVHRPHADTCTARSAS